MTDRPKAEGAFLTIGELSRDTGLPQHVLRYWETRFPQLRPLTRAGGRRYYRTQDVALVRRIDTALNRDGYTVRGVQLLLAGGTAPALDSLTEPARDPECAGGGTGDRPALTLNRHDHRSRVAAKRTFG